MIPKRSAAEQCGVVKECGRGGALPVREGKREAVCGKRNAAAFLGRVCSDIRGETAGVACAERGAA